MTEQDLQKKEEEMRAQFKKRFEEIGSKFDEVMGTITEKGYDKQSYAEGTKIEMDQADYHNILMLLTTTNQHMDKIRDTCQQLIQYTYSLCDITTMNLMETNTKLAELHIQNCEAGITVPEEEVMKADSAKKIKESSNLILPNTELILPEEEKEGKG